MRKSNKSLLYIKEFGWVMETTINRLNENGINEPYTIYEPINK